MVSSEPPTGSFARYDAGPAGSSWWVTYTVLRNPCGQAASIASLDASGVESGSKAEFTGETAALPMKDGDIPNLLLPGRQVIGMKLEGYALPAGGAVSILGKVRMRGPAPTPEGVPNMTLRVADASGPGVIKLSPDVTLCSCPPAT